MNGIKLRAKKKKRVWKIVIGLSRLAVNDSERSNVAVGDLLRTPAYFAVLLRLIFIWIALTCL